MTREPAGMLPSECPYPENNPENPVTHPLGSSQGQGLCNQCQRYFRRCPECRAANRWLARFCRNCGHPLEALNGLPDSADSRHQEIDFSWPLQFSSCLEPGFSARWAAILDGRTFVLGPGCQLGNLQGHPPRMDLPYSGLNGGVGSSPGYLHGFLVIPGNSGAGEGEDQLTIVDLLESRPGGNRKLLRLRGPLLCPLATDQGQWLAALILEGENRSLQLFRLHQGRLQLTWSQVLEGGRPDPNCIPRMLWCHQTLIYLDEGGLILGLDPIHGGEVLRMQCSGGPAMLNPWVRHDSAYWGGQDGSLWWLRMRPETQLHQLSSRQDSPMLALSIGPHDALVSYGRSLHRIRLETGVCEIQSLPQHCTVSPWVGPHRALACSMEGQIYVLALGGQTLQIQSTDRLPKPFGTMGLPPLWNGREWFFFDQEGHVMIGSQKVAAV